ncbi:MAG: folate-binding protein YgfZ [Gallionella sp.]|nr:folate-binding protein YgfZ [Gallionella sp.]
MNLDWQNFLAQRNAEIAEGIVQHFGDRMGEIHLTNTDTVLCDLHQFGALRVSGEEAQTFLQNLLSNDIREVTTHHTQLSSFNSAKGRMQATFLIWRDGEDYILQLPRSLVETMRKKLSMYVLRAKVQVTDASDALVVLGLAGNNAEKILREIFVDVPLEPLSSLANAQVNILKIDDARFQIITTPTQAAALWTRLSLDAYPVGSTCWDWLNIHAGIPIILPQTQEQFVAQMVNFDVIGGINFKKGCYPGQEIVARTHYLGKLKRRMYLAHIDTTELPQAGDELFSSDMEGQASGMLANAASSPDGGYDVLAVVQMSSQATQSIHWKSLQGETLQFLPLPYSLPST